MNRGLRFKIPNQYNKYFDEILFGIELSRYDWYISEDEIYQVNINEEGESHLFKKEAYNGFEFANIINDSMYYIVFANIKAFERGKPYNNIITHDEFIHSECSFMIIISDNVYVDVYCKDSVLIEKIWGNAIRFKFSDISYITNENDLRTDLKAI